MKQNDRLINSMIQNYDPDFKPFFETRLEARISKINEQRSYSGLYDRFFKRVLYSGFAALAAIILVIFLLNGSLESDALLGIKDLSLEKSLVLSVAEL